MKSIVRVQCVLRLGSLATPICADIGVSCVAVCAEIGVSCVWGGNGSCARQDGGVCCALRIAGDGSAESSPGYPTTMNLQFKPPPHSY
eukprot:483952-Rhodomonas_salina.2